MLFPDFICVHPIRGRASNGVHLRLNGFSQFPISNPHLRFTINGFVPFTVHRWLGEREADHLGPIPAAGASTDSRRDQ